MAQGKDEAHNPKRKVGKDRWTTLTPDAIQQVLNTDNELTPFLNMNNDLTDAQYIDAEMARADAEEYPDDSETPEEEEAAERRSQEYADSLYNSWKEDAQSDQADKRYGTDYNARRTTEMGKSDERDLED